MTVSGESKPSSAPRRARSARRKQRCWTFHVSGINRNGPKIKYADVLASFCERYTAVKRLVISPVSGANNGGNINLWRNVRVVVQFTGPQPSQGPGTLLCHLLSGNSFEAEPVVIGRGRKKKPSSLGSSSSEASDSEGEDGGVKIRRPRITHNIVGGGAAHAKRNIAISTPPTMGGVNFFHGNTAKRTPGANLTASAGLPPLPSSGLFKHEQFPTVTTSIPPPVASVGAPVRQHSLDIGDIILSSDSESAGACERIDCDEGEPSCLPLLDGLSSGDAWGAIGLGDEFPGPSPFFKPTQSLVRGCSFTAAGRNILSARPCGATEIEGDDVESYNIVRDISGEESSFPSEKMGQGFAMETGDTVDAQPCTRVQEVSPPSVRRIPESNVPMEITVESVRQVCDFEGIPTALTKRTSSPSANTYIQGRECRLAFTGLESVGQALQCLTITAHFWVDSSHKVVKIGSAVQVGPMNRTYSAVFYPSMDEIWPEVYRVTNVRTVEVDMVVEVRSRDGNFRFLGPKHNVSYRRAISPTQEVAQGARA